MMIHENRGWSPQSKADLEKNFSRIRDIVAKTNDEEARIKLARLQADKITNENKCINRAMAAKQLGYDYLFDVFFRRAYELGTLGKGEYREYQLSKLGI